MKAITFAAFGTASVLSVSEVPPPQRQPGQMRLRVHCSGINRADLSQRRGHYNAPDGESQILGLEVSGEVVETEGPSSSFAVGDKVMALLAGGGYAEEVCVDEGLVLPLPKGFSYAEGAAIPEAFITAYLNLFLLGEAAASSRVLIHAGASGVGTAALQLLRGNVAQVFATVGSREKAEACERLGAIPILYREEEFAKRIGAEQIDLILDPVGASYLASNLHCLAMDGRLILIALMGGKDTAIDLSLVHRRRLRIQGSTLRALPLGKKRAIIAQFRDRFLSAFATRTLRPVIDTIFPAVEIVKAHERMEANFNIGKIVTEW